MRKSGTINRIKNLSEEQFESLYQISSVLNSAVYQDDLIEEALDIVVKIIDAERGLFAEYKKEKDDFEIISARSSQLENIEDIGEFSSNVLREVIKKKKPLLHHDVQGDPQLSQFESVQIQKIKSIVGVPVFYEDEIWGVILADSRMNRKEFTEENLKFLDFFSNLVSLSLQKLFQLEKLQNQNLILQNKLASTEKLPKMLGESEEMRKIAKLIHKVAATNATVLILGESGTGKDLAAQAIHKLSEREAEPFLAQFCGAIPDNLLESELFGFKRGSFTGAESDKKGLLEVADKGTFFLDEIAEISPALQAKLLRVLENKEIMRIGDTKAKKIDVRIIAATNKDLNQLVKERKFREDLFYRLNIFPVTLPPLRERKTDIPILAHNFARRIKRWKNQNYCSRDEKIRRLSFSRKCSSAFEHCSARRNFI